MVTLPPLTTYVEPSSFYRDLRGNLFDKFADTKHLTRRLRALRHKYMQYGSIPSIPSPRRTAEQGPLTAQELNFFGAMPLEPDVLPEAERLVELMNTKKDRERENLVRSVALEKLFQLHGPEGMRTCIVFVATHGGYDLNSRGFAQSTRLPPNIVALTRITPTAPVHLRLEYSKTSKIHPLRQRTYRELMKGLRKYKQMFPEDKLSSGFLVRPADYLHIVEHKLVDTCQTDIEGDTREARVAELHKFLREDKDTRDEYVQLRKEYFKEFCGLQTMTYLQEHDIGLKLFARRPPDKEDFVGTNIYVIDVDTEETQLLWPATDAPQLMNLDEVLHAVASLGYENIIMYDISCQAEPGYKTTVEENRRKLQRDFAARYLLGGF